MSLSVAAFYRFVALPDAASLRPALQARCEALGLRGTILLAREGINGTVAGLPGAIDGLLAALRSGDFFGRRLADLNVTHTTAAAMPFGRMKVRLKREIITFGDPAADPTLRVGTPVEPADWNALIADGGVTVLDTRNAFEVAAGTFAGARDPDLTRFSDFRPFVDRHLDPARHRRVAMFCTGGIRCEKASALMLHRGFAEVYTLKGGILRYLERVPEAESLWSGACFVFDGRVALGHGLVERPTARAESTDV